MASSEFYPKETFANDTEAMPTLPQDLSCQDGMHDNNWVKICFWICKRSIAKNELTFWHTNVYISFVRSIFRCVLRIVFSVIIIEIKCLQGVYWYYIMQWTVFTIITIYLAQVISYRFISILYFIFSLPTSVLCRNQ